MMMRLSVFAALLFAACGTTTPPGDPEVTMASGDKSYYVVNKLLVPQQRTDYAIDLNGDNHVDNQLGSVISTLNSQNLDTQGGIDKAVSIGSVVLLISVQATSLTMADNVGVTIYAGKKQNMPDFMSGMGMFTVDAAGAMPAAFFGRINGGKLSTNNPVTTKNPVKMQLKFPLIPGAEPLVLTVNGAHVQFVAGTDMASGKPGLIQGELHGSIKNADIQGSIIPAVAMLLTDRVKGCKAVAGDGGMPPAGDGGMACSAGDMAILQLFDSGGCMNPDGSMAVGGDGIISICEVATNMIIMNVLAPDVQIYAADGTTYSPNPSKNAPMKDSLSLGLGFTAVQAATFQ